MGRNIIYCNNCGSSKLRWEYSVRNNSNIVDGCSYMRDMVPFAYLGCEECSETINTCSIEESIRIQLAWFGYDTREHEGCSREGCSREHKEGD